MKVTPTDLPGVLVIEPTAFGDERGWFLETWRAERYAEHGIGPEFVQANCSHSAKGVLRGLHYQWPEPQGKLVWVSHGRVFDVAVDIRPSSASYGQWTAVELDAHSHRQLWVPEGFAHGFQVLSESATFNYLCTRPYRGEFDAAIAWNDADIGVRWPLAPSGLSAKDEAAPRLSELSADRLPS
ncbi:dTDP-4-dehydrorhamnose 3,5-epimerase [Wenzhouxiangella sp. AB-CW3]|uniref:dTDP-4-dehydrorhamnose 3,5-epimerase n=1 Tax=Wenzhouxiangella sp. AB-CW3 TaxID=2771012 RepID=UPI00168A74CB|nr:dTDP-4-dehydrorhamnose 3,5-epimerase [Wenzhouxiangella sp. AB-CW3]QOC23599.1 dTDP-4-dehydrorhamnose 3,5-epimerase [Wenzhouxiangella sp. AB-CW3]